MRNTQLIVFFYFEFHFTRPAFTISSQHLIVRYVRAFHSHLRVRNKLNNAIKNLIDGVFFY
jgi:hypothetical protein